MGRNIKGISSLLTNRLMAALPLRKVDRWRLGALPPRERSSAMRCGAARCRGMQLGMWIGESCKFNFTENMVFVADGVWRATHLTHTHTCKFTHFIVLHISVLLLVLLFFLSKIINKLHLWKSLTKYAPFTHSHKQAHAFAVYVDKCHSSLLAFVCIFVCLCVFMRRYLNKLNWRK